MKWMKRQGFFFVLAAALATGSLACGEMDEENQNQAVNQNQDQNQNQNQNQDPEWEIEVAGTWENQFGLIEEIDDEIWDFMFVIDFDNDDRWAITQNPSDDDFNPDGYNRLVWTPIEGDVFYYCTVDFGLATEEDARTTDATGDASDLDGVGCNGFPWTRMERQ